MLRLAAAMLLGSALPASAFLADNGLPVTAGPSDTILVGARGATSARDFFCAAGDYARRVRAAGPTLEIVLLERPAPAAAFNGARTAQFALAPRGEGGGTGFAVRARAGESMSVAHARQLCAADMLFDRS